MQFSYPVDPGEWSWKDDPHFDEQSHPCWRKHFLCGPCLWAVVFSDTKYTMLSVKKNPKQQKHLKAFTCLNPKRQKKEKSTTTNQNNLPPWAIRHSSSFKQISGVLRWFMEFLTLELLSPRTYGVSWAKVMLLLRRRPEDPYLQSSVVAMLSFSSKGQR